MNKSIAIAAAAALVSCGGSSWVDPTSGTFTAQDSTEIMGLMSTALGSVQTSAGTGAKNALTAPRGADVTQSVTYSASCAASGTVAVTGTMNVDSNCTAATNCNFNGGLQLTLSACTNANALVGDGQINIGANGSSNQNASTFSLHETVQGGITVTRNGTAIGTCGINVVIDINETSTSSSVQVSGTVCKQAVQQ